MPADPEDADARRLAAQAIADGAPTAWFEQLYAEADAGTAVVPWDRERATPLLVEWLAGRDGAGRRAVVAGCGYGRDAEHVARCGYEVTAFDVSPTAIARARSRHPDSPVRYAVADLLNLPTEWTRAFDLVVESNNVQALLPHLHAAAAAGVASLLAPGGTVIVLAARGDGDADGPPWPLTRDEMDAFAVDGVSTQTLDALETDGVLRWRAVLHR